MATESATGSWVLDALLEPGSSVSRGSLNFLDKVFVALFICIFFLIWLTGGKEFHTYVFLFLAVGLAASVKFFVSELRKAQADGSITIGDKKETDDSEEAERARLQEQTEMAMKLEQDARVREEQRMAEEQQQEIRRRAAAAPSKT